MATGYPPPEAYPFDHFESWPGEAEVMETPDVPVRGRVLAQASNITLGDRNQAYGPPERNHQRIADMWSAYLNLDPARTDGYIEITANDVAVLMALLKIARTAEDTYHEDNYVDAAAYLAIAAEIRSNE